MPAPLYLDANASVPPLPAALAAFARVAAMRGNASAPHALGRALRRELDAARSAVAGALGVDEGGVVFTSGASEANRWWVDAVVARGGCPRVWMSPLEHPSVRRPLEAAAAGGAVALHVGSATEGGVDVGDVKGADVVAVTAAHNETGLLPDLDALAAAVDEDALLCVDAAQSVGRVDFAAGRADVVSCSAHKLGGPPGIGALWLSPRARALPAPWSGGGQEGGRRPGTEAAPLIASFGAAASEIDEIRRAHAALAPLRDRLETGLVEAWAPARVVGRGARLPNTSAILIEGVDGDALRMSIDRAGVCVGFGAACSALSVEPSPGLMALGLSPSEARAVVRLSLSPGDDDAVVDEALARLAGALPRRRA